MEKKKKLLKKSFEVTFANRRMENWLHCVKSVRIQSFSCLYFPGFGLNTERYSVGMPENTDQKNSEYWHFSRSAVVRS